MNIDIDLDSPSKKVRLIHDYTLAIKDDTTLSLENLGVEKGLDSLVDAGLSCQLYPFAWSFYINSCYTQLMTEGRFLNLSLNM